MQLDIKNGTVQRDDVGRGHVLGERGSTLSGGKGRWRTRITLSNSVGIVSLSEIKK